MRKLILLTLAVICAMAFAACERGCADCPGESVLGDVKVGESLHIDGESGAVSVHVLEVTEDSRCPADAECLTVGHVCVRLRVDTARPDGAGASSEETAMEIVDDDEPDSQFISGVHIRLYYIEPTLASGQTIPQTDYSVRMRITESAFSLSETSALCSAA